MYFNKQALWTGTQQSQTYEVQSRYNKCVLLIEPVTNEDLRYIHQIWKLLTAVMLCNKLRRIASTRPQRVCALRRMKRISLANITGDIPQYIKKLKISVKTQQRHRKMWCTAHYKKIINNTRNFHCHGFTQSPALEIYWEREMFSALLLKRKSWCLYE